MVIKDCFLTILNNFKIRNFSGVFGPPIGKKCVMFVDDLNLPQPDPHGAYPPLELLRQMLDHSTWYDVKKEVSALKLEDIQVLVQM